MRATQEANEQTASFTCGALCAAHFFYLGDAYRHPFFSKMNSSNVDVWEIAKKVEIIRNDAERSNRQRVVLI